MTIQAQSLYASSKDSEFQLSTKKVEKMEKSADKFEQVSEQVSEKLSDKSSEMLEHITEVQEVLSS